MRLDFVSGGTQDTMFVLAVVALTPLLDTQLGHTHPLSHYTIAKRLTTISL